MIYFGCNIIFTVYVCLDLEMMITRRSHVYEPTSWFAGFIDLQTDIFFKFWRDLFSKNPYEDAVDTQQELQADNQTPIHITVDEAQKRESLGTNTSGVNHKI